MNNQIIKIMKKYDVKVRYAFEGTYTVAAEARDEAKRMVVENCGLVLGGNIHTTLDDEEMDWNFGMHPDMQVLSVVPKNGNGASASIDFSGRIEELREGIIEAIRQLLQAHNMTEIRFPEDDGYDPVWVIWFSKNGDPYECMVRGLRVTENGLDVFAEEKESGDDVECYSPFDLGARNIDWLHGMYDAVWRQLEEDVEPQTEES